MTNSAAAKDLTMAAGIVMQLYYVLLAGALTRLSMHHGWGVPC
jgi:hypothetical protein